MTQNQQTYRKRLLASIHMHAKMQDMKAQGVWSDFLFGRWGVESSSMLSLEELKNLLDILNSRAVNIVKDEKHRPKPIETAKKKLDTATPKQIGKITALWATRSEKGDMDSLKRFCKRVVGTIPLHLESLKRSEASKIILAIEKL